GCGRLEPIAGLRNLPELLNIVLLHIQLGRRHVDQSASNLVQRSSGDTVAWIVEAVAHACDPGRLSAVLPAVEIEHGVVPKRAREPRTKPRSCNGGPAEVAEEEIRPSGPPPEVIEPPRAAPSQDKAWPEKPARPQPQWIGEINGSKQQAPIHQR